LVLDAVLLQVLAVLPESVEQQLLVELAAMEQLVQVAETELAVMVRTDLQVALLEALSLTVAAVEVDLTQLPLHLLVQHREEMVVAEPVPFQNRMHHLVCKPISEVQLQRSEMQI
jgi:predicted nicotinamide N-methyase